MSLAKKMGVLGRSALAIVVLIFLAVLMIVSLVFSMIRVALDLGYAGVTSGLKILRGTFQALAAGSK